MLRTSLRVKQLWMRERNSAGTIPSDESPTPDFRVRHYTVQEIAEMWSLGADAVRRMFEHEPGVLTLGRETTRSGKRRYVTLRVPEHVVKRVYRRQLSA